MAEIRAMASEVASLRLAPLLLQEIAAGNAYFQEDQPSELNVSIRRPIRISPLRGPVLD